MRTVEKREEKTMSIIRDISLAKSGHDKINWVKSYMPVLRSIEEEFREKKPFEGKKNRHVHSFGSEDRLSCNGFACRWR